MPGGVNSHFSFDPPPRSPGVAFPNTYTRIACCGCDGRSVGDSKSVFWLTVHTPYRVVVVT